MRLASWTLTVGALLFVSGIAFIIAGARSAARNVPVTSAPERPAIRTTLVADVRQIMKAITQPTADVLYKSVSTISTTAGVVETEPRTEEDWAHVAANAAALAESGNLLLADGRRLDDGAWVKMARDLTTAAQGALEVARNKNVDGILEAGSVVAETCDNCHARYMRQ